MVCSDDFSEDGMAEDFCLDVVSHDASKTHDYHQNCNVELASLLGQRSLNWLQKFCNSLLS
jgi:hypothetical protein